MASDVLFSLPFAKVKEMEKTFRVNRISDADILSFCDSLESDLKQICRNNLSQVNYTLSCALETTV